MISPLMIRAIKCILVRWSHWASSSAYFQDRPLKCLACDYFIILSRSLPPCIFAAFFPLTPCRGLLQRHNPVLDQHWDAVKQCHHKDFQLETLWRNNELLLWFLSEAGQWPEQPALFNLALSGGFALDHLQRFLLTSPVLLVCKTRPVSVHVKVSFLGTAGHLPPGIQKVFRLL